MTLLLAASMLVLLPVGSAAGEEPDAPKAPPTPLEKELVSIRKMMFNAQLKARQGVAGVDVADASSRKPLTPAQACCSGNLEHIAASMTKLREIVRDRTSCLERKRDLQGVEIANLAIRDMRGFDSSLQLFRGATNPAEVRGSLDACTRTYLKMADTLGVLPECGEPGEAAGGAPEDSH
jgi:hypothetical protein